MAKLTVEDTSLTAVADAIRSMGGTTDALVFPDGFVTAVENIVSNVPDIPQELIEGTVVNLTATYLKGCSLIRNDCFSNQGKIESVIMPEGIQSVGDRCFYNCERLASVVFSESIKIISYNSFALCKLTSVVIPKNVTYLGNQTFYHNLNLQTVEMKPTTPPTHPGNAFKDCPALTKIIVPAGTLSAYQSATNWSAHADIMEEATE